MASNASKAFTIILCVVLICATDAQSVGSSSSSDILLSVHDTTPDEIVSKFLMGYERKAKNKLSGLVEKKWNYYTNVTEETGVFKLEAKVEYTQFEDETRQEAQILYDNYESHEISHDLRRQLEALTSTSGSIKVFTNVTQELEAVKSGMEQRYLTGRVCRVNETTGEEECLRLDPDLKRIMAASRDEAELRWAWIGWRNETGAPTRGDFQKYVELSNTVAREGGFEDHGAFMRSQYGIDNLEQQMTDLLNELMPLYHHLHAFIRRRLYEIYGPEVIDLNGPIPAHLLGGMWSGSWSNLIDVAQPHQTVEIDTLFQEQGYDVQRMFESVDEYYQSMGLAEMSTTFWNHSIFVKPDDGRNMSCEPTAWDFKDGHEYRVVTCTSEITIESMSEMHTLLGRTQYQYQYSSQPIMYQQPASPALYEAMAGLTSSEVYSPAYLRRLGLSLQGTSTERNYNQRSLLFTRCTRTP